MRSAKLLSLIGLGSLQLLAVAVAAQENAPAPEPTEHVYAVRGETELKVHIFSPQPRNAKPKAAVAVFHGGGWTIGEASWAFPNARRFAEQGAVGVAVQYRLSDSETTTPLEAMADARDAIRWLRQRADVLGIDPDRIAVYGWSAGAHLGTCAAIFDDDLKKPATNAAPNALVLVSPAVAMSQNRYFDRLLLGRAKAPDASPDEHVRAGLPPTLILQGDVDTVTPLDGVERFCRRMRAAGNRCDLQVYEGYGHLFTPAGTPDDGWPQPDLKTRSAALDRADAFLKELGYLD